MRRLRWAMLLMLASLAWGCQAPPDSSPSPSPSAQPSVQASPSPIAGQLLTPDGRCSLVLPKWKVIDVDPDFQAVFDDVQASLAGGSSSARVESELLLSARELRGSDQAALHWSTASFMGKAPIVYVKPGSWAGAIKKQMSVQFPTSRIDTELLELPTGQAVRVKLSPGPGDKSALVHLLYVVPRPEGRFTLTFTTPARLSAGFVERTLPLARSLTVPDNYSHL